MAGEAEIQDFVEKLIGRGQLYAKIEGKDQIDRASAAHHSGTFIPNFNLDYLLRIQSICSASAVLKALQDVEIVSTAKRNVSTDRKERLFPDLILVSKTTGHIIVVEIKRDKLTSREAMTELLAYEQEIRNQMPYLSSGQIMYVLVSDMYPVLLSHAAGQVILWQQKNVLSLHLEGKAKAFSMKVTVPLGWSSTRLNHVPEHCFQVAELTVRSRSADDARALDALVLDITYVIARDGDRSGGHGFVLASHDHTASEADQHDVVYTIGVIDPALMQREVLAESDDAGKVSPIGAYATAKTWPTYDALAPLVETAREILSKHGECQVRSVGTLASWRDGSGSGPNVAYHYSPWTMLFWGLPHTYREALVHHDGLTRMFRFLKKLPSPQDHRIGLFVLDTLLARSPFQNGEFEHESLWNFSRTLGSTLAVLRGVNDSSEPGVPHPRAALEWLSIEVLSGLCEVAFRVTAIEDLADPPKFMWGGVEHATELLAMLEEWIAWFRESFLEESQDHKKSFDRGLLLHHLYDANLGFEIDAAEQAQLAESAVQDAKAVYQFATDKLADPNLPAFRKRRVLRILARSGLPAPPADITAVANEYWVRSLPTILGALDEFLPTVLHELLPPDLSGTDWEWMKQEALKVSKAGCKYVAVILHPGGQLAVSDITASAGPMTPITDYDAEVFVAIEDSGNLLTIRKVTWDEVFSGAAFTRDSASNGRVI